MLRRAPILAECPREPIFSTSPELVRAPSREAREGAVRVWRPMNIAGNALLLARHPRAFLGRRRYILVLSHMRSYSSLLCHILGSHPEIAGYAEMHLGYTSSLDLLRLRAGVLRSLGDELPGRFVLDKVLHDEYPVSPAILDKANVYPVILIREPVASIRSVITMGERNRGVGWYSAPQAVTAYYVSRIRSLVLLAQQLTSPYLFVRAEDIVERPSSLLPQIARFLDIGSPLTESYSIFPNTGRPGWGDESGAILAGRIVRPRDDPQPPPLGRALVSRAERAYDDCCRVLEG
jgi:hypothetical protein